MLVRGGSARSVGPPRIPAVLTLRGTRHSTAGSASLRVRVNSNVERPSRADAMKGLVKLAVVAGGLILAFLVASVAVAIRVASTSGPDAQASSGMYAEGDSLLFVAVFGVVALVPTGAALVFLRPYRRFWMVLSAVCLAVAVTGVIAAILFAVGRDAAPSPLAQWAALSVLRILVAPLLALTFLLCTVLAPQGSPRRALLAATVLEAGVSAYGGAVWFVPLFFQSR
jgi:hypothetical protein